MPPKPLPDDEVSKLRDLAVDPSPPLRRMARASLRALGEQGDPRAAAALATLPAADPSPEYSPPKREWARPTWSTKSPEEKRRIANETRAHAAYRMGRVKAGG